MNPYEVSDLMNGIDYCDRVSWEQSRLIGYFSAAPHVKKLEMRKMLPLPWDESEDMNEEKNTSITNEEIERLKKDAKRFEKYIDK